MENLSKSLSLVIGLRLALRWYFKDAVLLLFRVSSDRPFQVGKALGRINYSIAENDSVLFEDCLDYVSDKKRLRLL